MFLAGALSLIMFLLPGCFAGRPPWTRPTAVTEEQMRLDEQICRQAAGSATAPEPGPPPGQMPSIGIGNPSVADQMAAFDACMESKGYQRP